MSPEGFRYCGPLPSFVDDVYIDDPVSFLHHLSLWEVEEVEVLPEIMAGAVALRVPVRQHGWRGTPLSDHPPSTRGVFRTGETACGRSAS